MLRMVRFDDVYLYRFDADGVPEWMPKDEATHYPTSKMAHEMKRNAKRHEGRSANIVVVKLRPSQQSGEGGKP